MYFVYIKQENKERMRRDDAGWRVFRHVIMLPRGGDGQGREQSEMGKNSLMRMRGIISLFPLQSLQYMLEIQRMKFPYKLHFSPVSN